MVSDPFESTYDHRLQCVLLEECQQLVDPKELFGNNVLEVGCGSGRTTSQIADNFPHVREVLGIDSNTSLVDYAFTYVADEKMDFARADIEDQTTFELSWSGKFDFAFASHSLLFVKDHSTALRNLMWCLKPGGRCFLAVPASKPTDFHEAVKKVFTTDGMKKEFKDIPEVISDLSETNCNRLWFHHPNADRVYSALLEQVGYQVLNTKLMDYQFTFPNEKEYKECLECLIQQALQNLAKEKRASVLKQFCKAAAKKAKKVKGAIIWNVKYAIVLAKRPEL